ncbi:TetR family transcriptional regulator [Frankia sp. AgB32]|uniref:TetR/AcrR family transcriptional regulator n=1 Tax=Frankia sp. AgB32 TaxID=631119 RepID=UPI0034D50E6C
MAQARDGAVGRPDGGGRGAVTRALILETAMASFRDRGYDRTTMRDIARTAGVSVGNAYHYFGSKEELVQEFYAAIQAGHRQRAAEVLTSRDFTDRFRGVLHAGVDEMAPYHAFAGSFIKVAILPSSPSSPFSAESTAARAAAVGLFRDVVEGSDKRPGPLARNLPELLWLAYLGITLFWVHDTSPNQARTRRLIDSTARLVSRLVSLSRLPGSRLVTDDIGSLLADLRLPEVKAAGRIGTSAR